MSLTRLEREAITDSVLKIQSIQASLEHVRDATIPDREEIESCLETADKRLRVVLEKGSSGNEPPARP
jgi:predicted fused transcriptional regulator/phosphomethylpyrimidine kinase